MRNTKPKTSLAGAFMRWLHAPVYKQRVAVLADAILSHARANDLILDVGCGSGILGKVILDSPRCPDGVRVVGLELNKRGGEPIEVQTYDGQTFPFKDDTVELVILADVLHHEAFPGRLLAESIRVTKRIVFIKDHKVEGFFARQRISFLDWAANTGHGVKCLFLYNTKPEWNRFLSRFPVRITSEINCMDLYPPILNWIFGRRLHYCAVLQKSAGPPPR